MLAFYFSDHPKILRSLALDVLTAIADLSIRIRVSSLLARILASLRVVVCILSGPYLAPVEVLQGPVERGHY